MHWTRGVYACAALAGEGLRSRGRQAAYLVATLAIATAAWLTLAAVGSPYEGGAPDSAARIMLGPGNSGVSLPASYAGRIEAIHGARDVSWYGIQAVKCTATTVELNAFGGPGADAQLAKDKVPAPAIRQWNTDPLGAVATEAAASKCGWRVGQGVEPPTAVFDSTGHTTPGKPLALHIVGTFPGPFPQAYVHYDYINRAAPGIQGKDDVVSFFVRAADPREAELLAARIEAAFAHDFPAVNARTDTTVQNAWARFGKVQQLLAFVMAAVLLCAASVLVSVLAHAATERKPKLALLQVLGFRRGTLFGALALEVLAVVIAGALLGIGLERLLARALAPTTVGFLTGGVHVPAWGWWGLPAWLAALTAAALAWPAGVIARVRPADYGAI